jgi:predicted RNase H-like HicB family nuclease
MMKKYIYPAVFEPEDNYYNVSFPDLPGCFTFGRGYEEALAMAEEALRGHLYSLENDGDPIPTPSNPVSIKVSDGCFVSLVTAWMELVYSEQENKSVKKTLTIPKWLNDEAEELHINFSQVLQKELTKIVTHQG